jgi:hypothetical protein
MREIVAMWIVSLVLASGQIVPGAFADTPFGSRLLLGDDQLKEWIPFFPSPMHNPGDLVMREGSILHFTGKQTGYLSTRQSFANYHLHIEWRWGEKPAKGKSNSGIFLYTRKPDAIWPCGIQVQVKEGSSGDLIAMGDFTFPDSEGITTRPKLHPSNENASGEWNSTDIYCVNDSQNCTIRILINDLLQNSVKVAAQEPGPISLQSEGSAIDFRNIWVLEY